MTKMKNILKEIWLGFTLANEFRNKHQQFGKL
jgi:hypothetical protein